MSDGTGGIFRPIEPPATISANAQAEERALESAEREFPPNSVVMNFGRLGKIRWHAESGVPLFCFMSIVAFLIFGVVIGIISACNAAMSWPGDVFKFIGQAVLTLVGAVVGSAASSGAASRARRIPRG